MAGRGDWKKKNTKLNETPVREGKIHVRICGKERGLEEYDKALEILKAHGEDAYVIGSIIENEEKVILE